MKCPIYTPPWAFFSCLEQVLRLHWASHPDAESVAACGLFDGPERSDGTGGLAAKCLSVRIGASTVRTRIGRFKIAGTGLAAAVSAVAGSPPQTVEAWESQPPAGGFWF